MRRETHWPGLHFLEENQSPQRPSAARIRSAATFPVRTTRIVRSVSGLNGDALAGLPADVGQLLSAAPVIDKKLLELSVTWSGLPSGEARMAEALRVFVLTWDPLELDAPRPDGFAAVNPGSFGLELAVYVPIWRLINLAAARHESIAATLTAIAGSAVVTASVHEQEVTAGRYPTLVLEHSAPDLLADLPGGAALGPAVIRADPPSWEDIGLGAIQDVVQHAFGPVNLDRSQVELEALLPGQLGCPACAGKRFGFPADLSESRISMCPTHSKQADTVIKERLGRAEQSNPNGWPALCGATIRRERPHLPNGLATRLAEPARPCTSSRSQPNSPSEHERLSRRQTGSPGEGATSASRSARTRSTGPTSRTGCLTSSLTWVARAWRTRQCRWLKPWAASSRSCSQSSMPISELRSRRRAAATTRGRRSQRTWLPGRTISG